jgi:hypothetical protein
LQRLRRIHHRGNCLANDSATVTRVVAAEQRTSPKKTGDPDPEIRCPHTDDEVAKFAAGAD